MKVQAGLFVDLADSAIHVVFILVDLATGKAPVGALLPALHQDNGVHRVVEHDRATDRDSRFVLEELFEGFGMIFDGERRKKRTVLEDPKTKCP